MLLRGRWIDGEWASVSKSKLTRRKVTILRPRVASCSHRLEFNYSNLVKKKKPVIPEKQDGRLIGSIQKSSYRTKETNQIKDKENWQ